MTDNWVKVLSGSELYKTKIAEDILKQNGIESHIIEKGGSAIPAFGVVELYVPTDKAEDALKVLQENEIIE